MGKPFFKLEKSGTKPENETLREKGIYSKSSRLKKDKIRSLHVIKF